MDTITAEQTTTSTSATIPITDAVLRIRRRSARGGDESLDVTVRTTLNLFANVRPSTSYTPFVASAHPGINLVIVRENEKDLYAGIEHRQTREVTQVLKLVTRPARSGSSGTRSSTPARTDAAG